ncbi:MAG: hypothetical protein V3V95_03870 [Thermodesulfobacteriota bacterium]
MHGNTTIIRWKSSKEILLKKLFIIFTVAVFTLAMAASVRAEHDHSEDIVDTAARITVDDLKARIDKGENILILDVRSKQTGGHYGNLKIKGALLMPLKEVEARVGEIPFGALVAAYCT